MDGRHAGDEAKVRAGVAKAGLPTEIYDVIKALKSTGNVNFYACSLAAAIFGVDETNLIPEAEGIVGAAWFLNDKAAKADHYQYF
jgi:peroxiredoxin family protein